MRGYTLLELLVVLLVFSLLTGLMVPRLTTMYERFQFSYQKNDVFLKINELGYKAFKEGKIFILNSDSKNIELNEKWSLLTEESIYYQTNGICSGGIIYLLYENQKHKFLLNPPFCQLNDN